MNVTVDTTKCDGHEKCVQAAPNVFKMNARFIAEVADANGDTQEKVVLAARICPTKAITVADDDGKTLFPDS